MAVQAADCFPLKSGLVPRDRTHHVRRQLGGVDALHLLHLGELLPSLHDLEYQLEVVMTFLLLS